jgi:FkbM family methyltransferase
MIQHHPVFQQYRGYMGEVPAFTTVDFLGSRYRHQFTGGLHAPRDHAYQVSDPYPLFDEEYFEWISLLESALEAKGRYVMMELGAGFGRWVVRGGYAIRQAHPDMPFHLLAVEAEPTVYGWMLQNFRDNGIDPAQHSLLHGAVAESTHKVMFYIGGPKGGPYDKKPEAWYGQALTQDHDLEAMGRYDGEYLGFAVTEHHSGWRSIQVPAYSLGKLLKPYDRVDLIDMDLEGQELPAIERNIKDLDRKVRRLHIGTHGSDIEETLRRLLSAHGWECRADYPLRTVSQTPYGEIAFDNGAQSWVNPRLA